MKNLKESIKFITDILKEKKENPDKDINKIIDDLKNAKKEDK